MLDQGYQYVVVGLFYEARWRSAKLVQIQGRLGLSLNQKQLISGLGLILDKTHSKGLQFGPDFDRMDDMPSTEAGESVPILIVSASAIPANSPDSSFACSIAGEAPAASSTLAAMLVATRLVMHCTSGELARMRASSSDGDGMAQASSSTAT